MELLQKMWGAINFRPEAFACIHGCRCRFAFIPAIALALAACAGVPEKIASVEAFRDTKRLETELKKGVSTMEDVKRVLGDPTGSGAVFIASLQQRPVELWFYQDIELTDIKGSKGLLELKMRQQILLVFLRDGTFDGFMWFSNSEAATAWVKDSLQGKVGR